MAAGTSFLSSEMVNRRLLGPKPNFFNWRCSFAAGDLPPFLKIPLVLMLVCATAMAGSSVRKYVEFCDKGIIEQRALALFPKEHLYSQVRAVTMSHYYSFSRGRGGYVAPGRALYLFFQDGSRWSARGSDFNLHPAREREIAARVSKLSGVPISYPDAVLDHPQPSSRMNAVINGVILLLLLARASSLAPPPAAC